MAHSSQSFTGRYDEQLAELREIVGAVKGNSPAVGLRRIALATLETLEAKPEDTVHVSVNRAEDGAANRTVTVTVTITPAPVARK